MDDGELVYQGAEAKLFVLKEFEGKKIMLKERFSKSYRHPTLDLKIRKERHKNECKFLNKLSDIGISVPKFVKEDATSFKIYMEYVLNSITIKEFLESCDVNSSDKIKSICEKIGEILAKMHANDIIHGDLTTSNMLLTPQSEVFLIDFGLSSVKSKEEHKAVDLYLAEKAFLSSHYPLKAFLIHIYSGYEKNYQHGKQVIKRVESVKKRGRKL